MIMPVHHKDVPDLLKKLDSLSSSIQSVQLSTESKIRQIESDLSGTLKVLVTQFQQFQFQQTETLMQIESTFSERLSPIAETLQLHADALSLLPGFTEQLDQIESTTQLHLQTVTEEFTQVKQLAQQVIERRTTTIARSASGKPASGRVMVTEARQIEPKIDRKSFVFECLIEDSAMTLSAIQQRATERGLSISVGTISGYRSEFFEGRPSGEMKAIVVEPVSV
jgi:hypothetical protein